jgi:predicted transposase/invertase (TIGR01784 family)
VSFANPTKDISFKSLFKDLDNKALLVNFLNNMLQKSGDEEITEINIHDGELTTRALDEKVSILDIFCVDKSGHRYIVEMEKDIYKQHSKEGYFKRVQMYAGKTYAQQLRPGESYRTLKPLVCLVITDSKAFLEESDRFISTHKILDIHTHQHHLKDLSWTFVQIPKFSKKEGDLATELDEWMYMFKEGYKGVTFPKIKSPMVRRAYEVLDMSTWSEDKRMDYIREDMAIRDREDEILVAQDRGKEQGIIEGIEKRDFQLVHAWFKQGMPASQMATLIGRDEVWVHTTLATSLEDGKI